MMYFGLAEMNTCASYSLKTASHSISNIIPFNFVRMSQEAQYDGRDLWKWQHLSEIFGTGFSGLRDQTAKPAVFTADFACIGNHNALPFA